TIAHYPEAEETTDGKDQHRAGRPPGPGRIAAFPVPFEARTRPPGAHRTAQERAAAGPPLAARPGEMGGRSRRAQAPPALIVVDTTVWIDFLEARGTAFDRHLAELVEADASIALVDIIYCEVLQGIRDEEVYRRTRLNLLAYPILRPRSL